MYRGTLSLNISHTFSLHVSQYVFSRRTVLFRFSLDVSWYSPFPRRWDSKWSSECKSKSSMVIPGLFSNGWFEKRHELWPSRISIRVATSILSLVISGTGCTLSLNILRTFSLHISQYVLSRRTVLFRCTLDVSWHGVATMSRLLQITGLYCRRAL